MIRDDVIKRLATFGYTFDPSTDDWLLGFLIDKVGNYIRNQINRNEIPLELHEVYVDKVTGEFLEGKYASGQLTLDGIDFEGVVHKIQEGDTTVQMATSKEGSYTPEEKFLLGIQYLKHLDFSYARFRVFTW